MSAIARFFEFQERQTTFARELRGGLTTFLTMSYILIVNPSILAAAGIPVTAGATATALAAGICCILMGLYANFPLALTSGMGLNAMVAFVLTKETGSWQIAMGIIVLNGLLILLLVLAGVREAVLNALPKDLRLAIGAGIGLFIAVIGLQNGGLVVRSEATMITYGSFENPVAVLTLAGLLATAVLVAWRVPGALLIGIIGITAYAIWRTPPQVSTAVLKPDFTTLFKADVVGALKWSYVPLLLSVMMVDFFDTLGTATAVAETGGLADDRGRFPRLRRVLAVDSISASIGGWLGASSVTSYVESASGVAEGARTGLHTIVVGLLFLACVLLAPFVAYVPAAATAPALILVGFLMMSHVWQIKFDEPEKGIPAFLTLLTIPLTFSIAHGIGYGFISYVVLHLLRGRAREVHPMMYGLSLIFTIYFFEGNLVEAVQKLLFAK